MNATTQATIPVERTSIYPIRYAAFDRPGVLFVHDAPKQSGGHEWAVFFDHERDLYGAIVSYQDRGFLLQVCQWGKEVFSERMPYNYERAERHLLEELAKRKPARALEGYDLSDPTAPRRNWERNNDPDTANAPQ